MPVIDFHAHIVPDSYPVRPAGVIEPAWPEMRPVDDKLSSMVIGGKEYRKFESFYWDVDERIAQMGVNGIDMEVLSPLPELLSYWLNADAAVALTDYMNEFVGGMVVQAPDRFQGLGCVALQDPPRAVQQLEQLKKAHGLKGVHLGSHINGVSIADERFIPFFEAAEDLDLVLFVHGIKPGGLDRLLGSPLMGPVLGVPNETTAVIGSLIMSDILGRFPNLKFVFSHGGGGIGAVLDRFDLVWNKFDVMQVNGDVSPSEYARRFYYDTVTFSADYLGYLVRLLGADRFVAGTDGPTEIGQKDLPGFLARAGLSGSETELVTHENATRLLAL
jgi:aminocarboxymuconate-semialdehyde decarboxylase